MGKSVMISNLVWLLIFILMAGLAAGAIFFYRKRTKYVLKQVLEQIDDAIAGNVQTVVYNESMDTAIQERLNQFLYSSKLSKERTEEERDRIKALISDISHQIRTPLANIKLYSELLEETKFQDDNAAAMSRQIKNQADKLEFFMKELIRSSYLETDMITLQIKTVAADEIVEKAMQQTEMAAMKKGISISFEESGLTCLADSGWTVEAVSNILANAVKYSPEQTHVRIWIVPYELFLCIHVQDKGMGIREEEQGMIFKRFYRSPEAAGEKGLGIGLYLAREIIAKQGGYIKVNSETGKGATFSIFLKICQN